MTKIRAPKSNRAPKLTYEEFEAKHHELKEVLEMLCPIAECLSRSYTWAELLSTPSPRPPLPLCMAELKQTQFFRLLSAAGRENCPEAFNHFLYFWLRRMGIRIPQGVLLEPRRAPGRPRTGSKAYDTWIEIGCPPLGLKTLAAAVYGEEFTKANAAVRRKLIDRCRKAVPRYQQLRLGQNSQT